jgi:glutathione synthase/RimK-type ligase-like ATP-grasp enzyme
MVITYAGRSRPGAEMLAEQDGDIEITRSSIGDINWGRNYARTRLNPDISNATNKRRMRELFREHGVPMPELYYDIPQSWSGYFPCVGRPDTHTKGRGFWLCRNVNDVRRALHGTRRKKAATHFMEFIRADHEYRVHIFKGRSIRISEKEFYINEDGKRDYTTVRPTGRTRHVREAAKKAVDALGLDFGAVDILATDDDCWVLEVNTAPGLGGSTPRVYVEAFRRWETGEWQFRGG